MGKQVGRGTQSKSHTGGPPAFWKRMHQDQELVDAALLRWLPSPEEAPGELYEAMHYSVFAGGKRFRSILILESCRAVGGDLSNALPAAAAMEMIHTYSLIHDDLPCMDNAEVRRGQPACHRKYGETVAVLAGDALLTQAFVVLSREQVRQGVTPEAALEATALIADAAGALGMVGGQTLDIRSACKNDSDNVGRVELLLTIHKGKTGALIRAAAEVGAVVGGADASQRAALRNYGEQIGLAFQITDDLLDIQGTTATLGKDIAGDMRHDKVTFPAVFGLERSQAMAEEFLSGALTAVEGLGSNAGFLRTLAGFVVRRDK